MRPAHSLLSQACAVCTRLNGSSSSSLILAGSLFKHSLQHLIVRNDVDLDCVAKREPFVSPTLQDGWSALGSHYELSALERQVALSEELPHPIFDIRPRDRQLL